MITLDVEGIDLAGPGEAEGWLVGQARRALEELARRFTLTGELRVRLVRDPEMAALHARTMGLNETTDVLTFDLLDGEPPDTRAGRLDADVVLCADEARRQADQRGHTVERELLLYIIHAVLHCVPGFNDLTEADAARMHTIEDEVLHTIGVGAVFDR